MPPVPSEDQHERHESSQTAMLKDRRFKLNRACDRCRRRRIRCEESTPCASCVAAGSPCTFEEPGKKSHPHKSRRTSTLEERMAQLEALIQSMPANIFQAQQLLAASQSKPQSVNSNNSQEPPPSATSEVPTISFPTIAPFPAMGVPPPGLSTTKLTNPGTHFVPPPPASATDSTFNGFNQVTLSPTYLYWDDEGFTRWQGAASGLPLLDVLVERAAPQSATSEQSTRPEQKTPTAGINGQAYFPDRPPTKRVTINPETLWKTVTGSIPPDLMDNLVQSYLSTTFYLMPFLHIPTFLHDYSNPTKWGEPGFVSFVTAVCCLASRHIDDKRVREDPNDPFSSGTHWFGLFNKLRALPSADRPTLYTVQAVLVAAVYAVGLGRLSKGFALLSEAVTLSFDAGLHRSIEAYDCFDPIESEIRKRTFWAVYMWDKQVGAAFGRPPLIRLRDCDVPEPTVIDDEATHPQGTSPNGGAAKGDSPRMAAFVAAIRYFIVLESVLDAPPTLNASTTLNSPFLASAASTLVGFRRNREMHEEEMLLDEAVNLVPPYWSYCGEAQGTSAIGISAGIGGSPGEDVIQVTQKHRLFCLEQWIRMLVHRQRLTVAIGGADEDAEVQEMLACHQAAVNIIHSQLQMATQGLMGFFGVGAIHQLNQAGRTLVAVLLNCRTSSNLSHSSYGSPFTQNSAMFLQQQLVEPGLEALRSCVVLLRRFSVRYLCGLRSADLIEEFCRISKVPLEAPPFSTSSGNPAVRRAWLRPIRKKTASVAGSGTSPSDSGSPSTHGKDETHTREMDMSGQTLVGQVPIPGSSTSVGSVGISPSGPTLTANSTSPVFSGQAYEAYEALMNPPGSAGKASPSNGLVINAGNSLNGMNNGFQSMDGADLLNGGGLGGPDEILALLNNSAMEPQWDFGLMFPENGAAAGGNSNSATGGGVANGNGGNGLGGMYGSPSGLFNSANGPSFDTRDGFASAV